MIEDINLNYAETIKDAYIECGIEYNKPYPYTEETLKLFKKPEQLEKRRRDKLFSSILGFTQTYYSIKEYLCKEYPQKKRIIEDFFSEKTIGLIARKDISNDLKHNPVNDLIFKFGVVGKETIREPKKVIHKTNYKRTWFYADLDSVELCNRLHNELMDFLKQF